MDTYEFNKIAGAVLGTVLLIMVLRSAADIIYDTDHPETPAYSVAVEETEGHGGGETMQEAAVPIAQLLASASADEGAKVARKCASCHSFVEGAGNTVGPNLYDVVGRAVASVADYSYSDALRARAAEIGTWTFEALDDFVADPKAFVEGTKMGFNGISRDTQRADLLMYLRDQSSSPVDLPAVEAAPSDTAMPSDAAMPSEGTMPGGDASGTTGDTSHE